MNTTEIEDRVYLRVHNSIFNDLSEVINRRVMETVQKYLDLPLTVEQVAIMLDQSPDVIYKWHQRGRLIFSKKCGRLTITLKEVNRQLVSDSTHIGLDELKQHIAAGVD